MISEIRLIHFDQKVRVSVGCSLRDISQMDTAGLGVKTDPKATQIGCMQELGKPYKLLLLKGRNPARDDEGLEGKGTLKKANASL